MPTLHSDAPFFANLAESLIDAINSDIAIARQKFEEPGVNAVQKNSFFD